MFKLNNKMFFTTRRQLIFMCHPVTAIRKMDLSDKYKWLIKVSSSSCLYSTRRVPKSNLRSVAHKVWGTSSNRCSWLIIYCSTDLTIPQFLCCLPVGAWSSLFHLRGLVSSYLGHSSPSVRGPATYLTIYTPLAFIFKWDPSLLFKFNGLGVT